LAKSESSNGHERYLDRLSKGTTQKQMLNRFIILTTQHTQRISLNSLMSKQIHTINSYVSKASQTLIFVFKGTGTFQMCSQGLDTPLKLKTDNRT